MVFEGRATRRVPVWAVRTGARDGGDNRDISLMIATARAHVLRGQESGSLAQAGVASRSSPGGGASGRPAGADRPDRILVYRLIWRPALAETVGDGRPWTVLMISLLSMP